jgi:hypothetical protein
MNNHLVDCIVRFHDVRRLGELQRCVFSLLGQSHRPVNIILALQRFSKSDIASTQHVLRPMLDLPGAPQLTVCNLDQPTPADARTLLLNSGLDAARGRYVGFLDYDDVLYPEAYTLLTERLHLPSVAIAFATVRVVHVDVYPQFLRVAKEVKNPFGPGNRLRDLFDGNFCPIHSFLIDRQKIAKEDLIFDSSLTWEEDYDLLLRLCAKYRSDFNLIGTPVGDYYYKRDGSNSIPINGLQSQAQTEAYDRIITLMEARRRTTTVSAEVQAEQGLTPIQPSMTIRDFMTIVPGRDDGVGQGAVT